MLKLSYLYVFIILFSFIACQEEITRNTDFSPSDVSLLEPVSASESGISFINKIEETNQYNIVTYSGMLQGSGLGVLDYDNDGLMDIYYCNTLMPDILLKNQGNLKFKDVSKEAMIPQENLFSTSAIIVDINQDGYDDVYVCRYMFDDSLKLKNQLLVNQQDGTFKNEAEKYGIADMGYSTSAVFFDMDNDNDLDLYVGNQPPNSMFLKKQLKGYVAYKFTDKLYRNDGGKFTDITENAGVKNYSYTLSTTALDYNKDGYTDIYVANDYEEPDFLYLNNGDGTFTNKADAAMRHMSNFAMGADVADIDNDGLEDLFVVDMVAEDNFRLKTNMGGMNPEKFWNLAKHGYHYQYMFNTLQRNNGNGTFSEMAQLAGISNSDWSWSPLFIDFDQDGYKDLVVTNGIFKEDRNKDYNIWRENYVNEINERRANGDQNAIVDLMKISNKAPSFKIPNFVYRNNGNLEFEKMNEAWNFTDETWSQGSAYADFDNDGDLDIVINNTNMLPQLYRNTANDQRLNNYIMISLKGPKGNLKGHNAKVVIKYGDQQQMSHINPYRGYMSSSAPVAHFGLGEASMVENIEVTWPDGKVTSLSNVDANKSIVVDYSEASTTASKDEAHQQLFQSVKVADSIVYAENEYDDYKREILLPHKMSTLGPIVAKSDVNGDGLQDFYLGGAKGNKGQLFMATEDGKYQLSNQSDFAKDARYEDGGALFFDADADGDLDLYVSSGGNEESAYSNYYQDRLYINSNGKFVKSSLPKITSSTSAIAADDVDGDGDLDLFVGGRQVPGKYGYKPTSYFLYNEKGKFKIDETFEGEIGMITDAKFVNIDKSEEKELVLIGEWMPLTILSYKNDKWTRSIKANSQGWWNTINATDIDGDGDIDLLAGNLGKNIKFKASADQPFKLFVDDFDENASNDVYLGYYGNDGKCYPVRGRQCSSEQLPFVKKEFETYNDFGNATIEEVLDGRMDQNTVTEEVKEFRNGIFFNDGNGQFEFKELHNYAQISPIMEYVVMDVNKDGRLDFVAGGNYYNREVETTRSDAGIGLVGIQAENGDFDIQLVNKTGIYAPHDVRAVKSFEIGGKTLVAFFNNNANAQFFQLK